MGLIIASYGGGVNSTAMLIEWVNQGRQLDLIMFADTGAERPHTYQYLERFQSWLMGRGYGPIHVVRKAGNCETLEENCLRMNMLPSLAYGFNRIVREFFNWINR